ncbi:MAG: YggT family protein [Halieaceae bacterium]|jgi:YggT family protein|nr:YggT family protein [Halieaceae bacterium]
MSAINEILGYLVQTFLSLYLAAMLLRFLLQLVRADFYNPISQFLVKVTNPLVIPLRRVIPGLGGLDLASLLLAVLLQLAGIILMLVINGIGLPGIFTLLVWSVLGVLGLLVNIYFFALLGMIILSWVAAGSRHPAIYLLYQITEPVMAPFRKVLPAMGGLDFSPILVFILINIIQIALRHMAQAAGLHPALVIGI